MAYSNRGGRGIALRHHKGSSFMFKVEFKNFKSSLFLGVASVSALGFASAAFGQAATSDTETVVVTGSRIPSGAVSASPITVVGQQDIQYQGANSVGALLQELPSVVNDGDGSSVTNGSTGISTIDLRNLGTKRTLVLVDGKRLVAADASLNVDTSVIPSGMVDHIEVLTGGDSAVYGSDAVAGVVNIILKKNFEGLSFDNQENVTDSGDGLQTDSNLVLGMNSGDGKGNITIYGEYLHRDPVTEASRPYGANALAATNYTGCATPATHFGGFCNSGSGTIPNGRIKSAALGGPYGPTVSATGAPVAGKTTMFTAAGTLVPYDGSTFNFAPYQYYQTQAQRYSFGAEAHYKVNADMDFYSRLTFANNSVTTQIGPSPLTANFDINCGNPNLSVEERQDIFGTTATTGTPNAQCATIPATSSIYTSAANGNGTAASYLASGNYAPVQRLVSVALRLTAAGPRASTYEHNSFQFVGGLRGDLPFLPGFTYDVSGQYGHTSLNEAEYNDAQKSKFQNGLLVDPATGNCYSGSPCVPINLFTAGGISQAAVNYFSETLVLANSVTQMDLQGSVTGDLSRWGILSPWAKDPIGVSAGGEYRQERATTTPDNNLQTGNLVGYSAVAATSGEFDVAEGFGELQIPIVQGVPGIEDLSFHGAYRYSSYDKAGSTNTFVTQVKWAPIEDFAIRASFDRSVRAPNVAELFTPAGGSSSNAGRDPCSASNGGIATTAALCTATGVPAGSVFSASLNCPTNQCQGAVGGNPFLKPEVSVTRELGVVLTPTFIPNFSATVDYYDIDINGYITQTPLSTILANCYSTAINTAQSASNPYCSFVHRDALGSITTANTGYVVQAEGNVGSDLVHGVDFEVNYNLGLDNLGLDNWGGLSWNYRSTWVQTDNTTFPGAATLKCAGVWGTQCGEPQLRYKGNLRTTWTDPSNTVSVSLLWRYLSSAQFEQNRTGFVNKPTLHMPNENYFDLSGTWAFSNALMFRAGVRNIFGINPPLTDNNTAPASDINGNTFPNDYDALGRVFFVGVTAKL
jgi:outer membrane receptor protein involved in Fe transport